MDHTNIISALPNLTSVDVIISALPNLTSVDVT